MNDSGGGGQGDDTGAGVSCGGFGRVSSCGERELGPAGRRDLIFTAVCVPTDASLCAKTPFNAASCSFDMEVPEPSAGNIDDSDDDTFTDGDGATDKEVDGSSGRAVTCVPESLIGAVEMGMFERDWNDMVRGGKKLGDSDDGIGAAAGNDEAAAMPLALPPLLLVFADF